MSHPRLNIFSSRKVVINGVERTLRTRVGVAFRHRNGDGYNFLIDKNIAVSNELVLFPPRDLPTDPDRKSPPDPQRRDVAPDVPPLPVDDGFADDEDWPEIPF